MPWCSLDRKIFRRPNTYSFVSPPKSYRNAMHHQKTQRETAAMSVRSSRLGIRLIRWHIWSLRWAVHSFARCICSGRTRHGALNRPLDHSCHTAVWPAQMLTFWKGLIMKSPIFEVGLLGFRPYWLLPNHSGHAHLHCHCQARAAMSASLHERKRSLFPKIMSSENAIGSAIRMLCPQTCSHVHESPNSMRLNTPDKAVDMKEDMTKEPESRCRCLR